MFSVIFRFFPLPVFDTWTSWFAPSMVQQMPEVIVSLSWNTVHCIYTKNTVHCIYTKGSDKEMTLTFYFIAAYKLDMLKFHRTSLQGSWCYSCFKIYSLSFWQYAFIFKPDNAFPPHISAFLPLLPLAHAVLQCPVTAVMSSQFFFQTTFIMASVRRTVCVA